MACRNPRFASTKLLEHEACESAGCCYDDGDCFQPLAVGYELLTLDETDSGWKGTLVLRDGHRGPFGNDVALLELHVTRESTGQVRIRVTDPAFPRFEVPDLPVRRHRDKEKGGENESDFEVHFTSWPFGVAVTRRHSGEVLFNSTPPVERENEGASFSGLVFENQFLEFSTQLAETSGDDEPVLYGLGERVGPARLRADKEGGLYPMFARAPNTSAPVHSRSGGDNLYGVHPFVLQLENGHSGQAHGIFVLSANALEAVVRRDALTFRLTGGIIDVFVFSGPSPQDVIEQYTDVVGRPELPPYWALGYHVGNRGGDDPSADDALKVVTKLRLAGVPMDAYWQDIEYMADDGRALSLDESKFSRQDMRSFINDLHFHGQYFVCVQVPAIRSQNLSRGDDSDQHAGRMTKYNAEADVQRSVVTMQIDEERDHEWDPMARGEELDVFVKGIHGERYAQKAFWSQWAVFVDFFHPNAQQYWHEQLAKFHKYVLPFDGLWLDMNEPSSTCDCTFAAEDDISSWDQLRLSIAGTLQMNLLGVPLTGPNMHADLSEIRVYGVYGAGFSSNSSLHTTLAVSNSEGPHHQHSVKADYFAQSNMLVLTRLNIPIGQEFHVKVEARSTAGEKEKGDGKKSVDANASGQSGSENAHDEASEKSPMMKSMFSITGIVVIAVGGVLLLVIILVFLVRCRRHRQGYEAIG
ncbi:hypothetical protein BBJ29_001744 [Phytophthora kernoviae]|uniref:Maltase n=1 Tax=Phytophthora kernoviae TaxID=325452 RepID=A0A3F2RSH5_9STRA|nr:hypothetical protein BBP00_00004178 [Phytophthora kernoviae]RLN70204.1 hypothetical protein BBJ29_001744 [Phytophthora kernoviae]